MKRKAEPAHRHRVIVYSHDVELLGAERALLLVVQHLVARGYVVLVVVPRHGPLISRLEEKGARVVRCRMPMWLARTKAWPVFLARVLGAIATFPFLLWISARFRPCIAYTNSWVIPEGAVAARLLRVPHIWHIREYELGNETLQSQLPMSVIRRLTLRWSTELLAISSGVADQFDRDDVRVVHAGVEIERTDGASEPDDAIWLRAGSPSLLLLGTISAAKGTAVAIEAMAVVRDQLPGARLLIAGHGKPALLDTLRATIASHGLQDGVHIVPFSDEPISLMRASDIVLMPSRHEAYGLVTVQALTLGIPVVGSASGGTRDLLTLGGGLLAEVGEPRHFAGHIEAIATDGALRDWLSAQGRAAAATLSPDAEGRAVEDEVKRHCLSD